MAQSATPLVYERFENSAAGKIEGGVRFDTDVVGYGGLKSDAPNCGSAFFDGSAGSSVYLGRRPIAGDFTVQAFVKLVKKGSYHVIASAWDEDADQRSWALVVLPDGCLRFDTSPDGRFHPENVLVSRPRSIPPAQWVHVAAVNAANTSFLYLNAKPAGKLARPTPGIFAGKANLRIGSADRYATTGPRPFRGWIDEVQIVPKALGPTEFFTTREPMPEVKPPGPPTEFVLPFRARSSEEAIAWQNQARGRLLELVALQQPRFPTAQVPLDLRLDPGEDRGAYSLHRISYRGNGDDGRRYHGLLALPKGTGPFPALLALHGHGGNANLVFDRNSLYEGFADRFAGGGYVVLAPTFPHQEFAALVLWDLFRCVDILETQPRVDRTRIGVAGLSMGGEWTMWIAACDTRLKAAVVSGWMCTTEGIFSVPNCECWQLPGLVELMDACELHLVIAPRPVLFESAEHDECFPIQYTRAGFARIKAGYTVFGAADAVQQDIWPAGHRWHGQVAFPFIDRVLGGHAANPK